jgi:hypothetical protein
MANPTSPWWREPDDDRTIAAGPCRRRAIVVAGLVLVVTCVLLDDIGLVWDEPFYFSKQYRMDGWYRQVFGSARERAKAFTREELLDAWNFARSVPHENPPVYAILSHLTWRITRGLWSLIGDRRSCELRGHRLAPALLFSVTAGILYALAWRHWGTLPALVALGAWVLNPRVFAHGRLATTDMIMTGFWCLAAAAFLDSTDRRRRGWMFGPLAGLAAMSKATGVLAVGAQLVWSLLYRQPYARTIFLWAALLTPLTALTVHPAWWLDPLNGVKAAIDVHRHRHEIQNVKTLYLGRVYEHDLPWHNTIVLTAACVPAAWFLLASIGLVGLVRGGWRSPFVGWATINWATLIIVRATPIAPGHDGIRQFLAAFPFFALLAAYGFYTLLGMLRLRYAGASRAQTQGKPGSARAVAAWDTGSDIVTTGGKFRIAAAVVVLALAWGSALAAWVRIRPYELSFYSELIGGLKGAQRLGLETTYYWDAASWETLQYLNTLPAGTSIGIPYELHVFTYYQRWGYLRPDLEFIQERSGPRPPPNLYLILAREGTLTGRALDMLRGDAEFTVERQGVRLLALVANRPGS